MEFKILDPKSNKPEVHASYDLWSKIWFHVLRDLDGLKKLDSDAFLNLDAIGTIFDEGKPIVFHGYKFHDLENRTEIDRATFSAYQEEAFSRLRFNKCKIALTLEWACIEPTYRKVGGRHLLKLLTALSLNYWRFTGADCALATTYNLKKVDDLCRYFNCEQLCDDGVSHGVGVSFFATYKDRHKKYVPEDARIQLMADEMFAKVFQRESRNAPELFL